MVNYERAIKRPFKDLKNLVIGIILQWIPVVNLAALGYQLKCAKTAANNDFKLPEWDDWGKLFVTGLMAIVIDIVYSLPAMIVLFVSIGMALISLLGSLQAGAEGVGALLSLGSLSIGVLLGLILALLAVYITPLAMVSYVKNEKIGDAFKLKILLKKALKVKYLVPWLAMALYAAVLSTLLSVIPYFGTGAGAFIAFVTALTVFGEIYDEL